VAEGSQTEAPPPTDTTVTSDSSRGVQLVILVPTHIARAGSPLHHGLCA
jgi:hypothetical protein